MNRFCIIANHDKDVGYEVAKEIKDFFEEKHKCAEIIESTASIDITGCFEMAIVLGGDGTMIQAAKGLEKLNVPILGINLGTLGFLTEVEKGNLFSALEKILRGDFFIQKRVALQGSAVVSREQKELGLAVNDFIIGKRGFGRIITMSVYVSGELVDEYVADGILLATPTGSTAYNLSAGGPILSPEMEAIIITPICPHSLNKRSIVVSSSDSILVKVGQTREGMKDLATISVDGKLLSEASTGDTIQIEVALHRIQTVKVIENGFFERMRSKLNRY